MNNGNKIKRTVLLIGGLGRMEDLYRTCAKSLDIDLLYYENRIPAGTLPTGLSAILVVVPLCSHSLREHAARLAVAHKIPIDYLRKGSI